MVSKYVVHLFHLAEIVVQFSYLFFQGFYSFYFDSGRLRLILSRIHSEVFVFFLQ